VVADIADEAAVRDIFSGIPRIDHVVISAGNLGNGRIVQNDMATLRRIVDERIFGLVKNRAAALPGKRIGTAEEVAQLMLMLMSNAYVNGAVLHVDGGGRYI
jgi:NADP-dependent 3-hydroxy acid dehydrogenase YdfG